MSKDNHTYKELKAEWKNEVELHEMTKEEIAKHNTKKSLWIAIHGRVFDVTEYAQDHPGGADVLREVAGKDATSDYEDVGHSEDAGEIMQGFVIGTVKGAQVGVPKNVPTDSTPKITIKTAGDVSSSDSKRTQSDVRITQANSTMLTAGGVGAAAVLALILANRYGTISIPASFSKHISNSSSSNSFLQGFLTASAAAGVVSLVAAYYGYKFIAQPGGGFQQYPAHRPSSNPSKIWHPHGTLHPSRYQNYKLRSKKELSQGIWRFIFDLPTRDSILGLPIGQHVAIRATIGGKTVTRSYTPISNNRDLGRLELLIRVYDKGAMGNYLKDLPVGATAEIRGPKGAMKYRRNLCTEIGMIGGGTGITPLYQVLRAICEDPNDNTKITLLYGNRSEQDIMLLKEMDALAKQNPQKLSIHYTLDHPSESWTGGRGYISKELLQEKLPKPSSTSKILLCGPPGMVEATKNNLTSLGFEHPSPVGKMTDQIFCF